MALPAQAPASEKLEVRAGDLTALSVARGLLPAWALMELKERPLPTLFSQKILPLS